MRGAGDSKREAGRLLFSKPTPGSAVSHPGLSQAPGQSHALDTLVESCAQRWGSPFENRARSPSPEGYGHRLARPLAAPDSPRPCSSVCPGIRGSRKFGRIIARPVSQSRLALAERARAGRTSSSRSGRLRDPEERPRRTAAHSPTASARKVDRRRRTVRRRGSADAAPEFRRAP